LLGGGGLKEKNSLCFVLLFGLAKIFKNFLSNKFFLFSMLILIMSTNSLAIHQINAPKNNSKVLVIPLPELISKIDTYTIPQYILRPSNILKIENKRLDVSYNNVFGSNYTFLKQKSLNITLNFLSNTTDQNMIKKSLFINIKDINQAGADTQDSADSDFSEEVAEPIQGQKISPRRLLKNLQNFILAIFKK
jgi:hypothetical protein